MEFFFFFFFSSRRRHTRFSRDWSSDVCSSDLPAGQVEVDFHVCGDPLADPWQGEATYVSEGDLLILATAWAFSAGAFTSPVDEYGNVFGILGSLDLEADPPVAHFQLKAYNGTLLTPTLELTDYDGCPPSGRPLAASQPPV